MKGFSRVSLDPGESKSVTFNIDRGHLSFYDVNTRSWVVEPGEFEVMVDSSSRKIRLKDTFSVINY